MSYRAKPDNPPRMPDAPTHQCIAHGCPLRATIFDSVIGTSSNGRCRYHDAANPSDWPYLTDILQSRPFTREDIEPALASIGLRWQEPKARRAGPYHSKHTGVTVHDRESFKHWWALYSTNPPPTRHKAQVGSFAHMGALVGTTYDEEWDAERVAIQQEGDPL